MPADITDDMEAAAICREMKWTHEDYLNAPVAFLQALKAMMSAEAKASKQK